MFGAAGLTPVRVSITIEASKALARAREAVELALARAEAGESAVKAMKELERDWLRAMNKIAERVALTSPYTRR